MTRGVTERIITEGKAVGEAEEEEVEEIQEEDVVVTEEGLGEDSVSVVAAIVAVALEEDHEVLEVTHVEVGEAGEGAARVEIEIKLLLAHFPIIRSTLSSSTRKPVQHLTRHDLTSYSTRSTL